MGGGEGLAMQYVLLRSSFIIEKEIDEFLVFNYIISFCLEIRFHNLKNHFFKNEIISYSVVIG